MGVYSRENLLCKTSFVDGEGVWVSGNRYMLTCGSKGFTIESEAGMQEFPYTKMDGLLVNFEVPKRKIM